MVDSSPSAFLVDGKPVERDRFDRIALDPAHSVIIQACAGSGKTWLLVARLLRLLLAGVKPSEILSITFTRKAAQEMQERLMELLKTLATSPDAQARDLLLARGLSSTDAQEALPRARALFETVLTSPGVMTIDTFHGWFARVVRGAPLAAGVPAGFALAERTFDLRELARRQFLLRLESDAALRTTYQDLLTRVGEHAGWQLIWTMLRNRNAWQALLGGASVAAGLTTLRRQLGVLGSPEGDDEPATDPRTRFLDQPGLIDMLRDIGAALVQGSAKDIARAAPVLKLLDEGPRALDPGEFAVLRKMIEFKNGQPRLPTAALVKAAQRLWGPEGEERVRRALETCAQACALARERGVDLDNFLLNRSVWLCAEAVLEEYRAAKRARGALDFDDLEWLAYSLARDEASAAYIQTRLDARYRHVLVDEFQDTNPLQWTTLRCWLEAYGSDGERPRVFVVGDPNQSIYRFRGAEPRLFDEAARFLATHYAARRLTTSQTRRCAPEIVELLNGVFLASQPSQYQAHVTPRQVRGDVWRIAPIASLPASSRQAGQSVSGPGMWNGVLRDALTEARVDPESLGHDEEARAVADAICNLVGVRRIEVDEAIGATGRLAQYRDVFVLVRKRVRMAAFERAFRAAGIPYSSDRAGGLLATLEALDMSALLRFLIVPFSDHLLAHVLRTPIFAATDADLARLARLQALGLTWWDRLLALPEDDPLQPARQRLSGWIELAGIRPVHDLLDRIFHEGRVIHNYVAHVAADAPATLAEQIRSNLLAFVELALQMDSGRYPSLPRFIAELDELAAGSEQESPDEGVTDFGDTVRILTIHGAKGLEAPIVFVTDACGASAPSRAHQALIDWPCGQDAPRHLSVFTSKASHGIARQTLFDEEARLTDQEDRNLLYVAATRAREILVCSGVESNRTDAASSWYARCAAFLEPAPLWARSNGMQDSRETSLRSILISDFQPQLMSIGSRHASPVDDIDGDRMARRRGIALHTVLERTELDLDDVADAARVAGREGLDPGNALEVAQLAIGILKEPGLKRFFDPKGYLRAWNEIEIQSGMDNLVRLDRLVEFQQEVWVLDYKSQTSAAGVEAHRPQLEHYSIVVGKLFPEKRVRLGVIFSDAVLVELASRELG